MNLIESKLYQKELDKIIKTSKKSTADRILERVALFVECQTNNKPLPADFKDHALNDNKKYQNCRECHLRGDTLLIYRIENNELELVLLRIGSHSQLFTSLKCSNWKGFSLQEAFKEMKRIRD